jgi:hypothetical protein
MSSLFKAYSLRFGKARMFSSPCLFGIVLGAVVSGIRQENEIKPTNTRKEECKLFILYIRKCTLL